MRLGPTIPSLPVADTVAAAAWWTERLGFATLHAEPGFARMQRDDAEIHLWAADHTDWRERADLAERPVRSGGESFLAGTASCRVRCDELAGLDALYAELGATEVLHGVSAGGPQDTDYGLRELHALDQDGNLVTFWAPL